MQFEQMEAVTISMNGQMPVGQTSPVHSLQAGLLQPHVMAANQVNQNI